MCLGSGLRVPLPCGLTPERPKERFDRSLLSTHLGCAHWLNNLELVTERCDLPERVSDSAIDTEDHVPGLSATGCDCHSQGASATSIVRGCGARDQPMLACAPDGRSVRTLEDAVS